MIFIQALFVSLALHVALAGALACYLVYAPCPDVLASLDLTSVELSFAEEEDSAAALAPLPPAPEPPPARPRDETTPPPETVRETPTPPEPDAVRLPVLEPARTQLPEREIRKTTPQEAPPEPVVRPVPQAPAPAVAPRQARVDAPPRPTKAIRPDYPKGARQRGEQGDVTLELAVDAAGRVTSVRVAQSSGFAELDEAAVHAVRSARFNPARAGSEAVSSTARLKLTFKLK